MDVERFRNRPLMGILRGISEDSVGPLFEAIESGGLETVEIAMNTEGAPGLIKKARGLGSKRLMIGAGTVLTMESLRAALDVGATFIVIPVVVREISAYCVQNKIPVFPGAFDPQGIYDAWCAGATMVKVFPSKFLGPEYFKEIKGPFPNIELLACAGVTPQNLKDYFASGASAAAIGSSVFRKDWIELKAFGQIANRIKEYIAALAPLSKCCTGTSKV